MTARSRRLLFGLAGALGGLLAGAAQASVRSGPAPPPKPPLAGIPDVAPAEGKVVLRCKVTPDRTLEACEVASETPAGHGLGQAALGMAKGVRIQSETFRPEMVGRTLEIPMRFAQDAPAEDEAPVASMP